MYHIVKQNICLRQEKTAAHKYLFVWWIDRRGDGGGEVTLLAVSVLPLSFNSPNDVRSSPAGPVLGLDQRMQEAAFEGIKEKTPAVKQI